MDRADLELLLAEFFVSSDCPFGVDAAYLFGSRARGTAREGSDVDVGILFSPQVIRAWPLPELSIQAALESRSPLTFDVVSIADAPVDLVHRILRDGRLVYDGSRRRRIVFEVRARNEFFDIEPILRRYRLARTPA